jgi:hypothetical protein
MPALSPSIIPQVDTSTFREFPKRQKVEKKATIRVIEAPRRVAELCGKNQRCVNLAALTRGLSKALKSQRFYVIFPYCDKWKFCRHETMVRLTRAGSDASIISKHYSKLNTSMFRQLSKCRNDDQSIFAEASTTLSVVLRNALISPLCLSQ